MDILGPKLGLLLPTAIRPVATGDRRGLRTSAHKLGINSSHMATGDGNRGRRETTASVSSLDNFDVVRINYTYATLEFDVQQRGVMFICVETVA